MEAMSAGRIYMKQGSILVCLVVCLGAASVATGQAGDWYVPMVDQVPGGFDHIQILAATPHTFDAPAMSSFFGQDSEGELVLAGEQWGQMFLTDRRDFASAVGPNLGEDTLVFDVWIAGDRPVGTPPGDADLDGDVDLDDFVRLKVDFGVGDTWAQGDFDGNGITDLDDFVILKLNFGTRYYPTFHYQTYREGTRVGNWDIRCIGLGELDWIVEPGTWAIDQPFLGWPPGDADLDGDVDLDDFILLKINFGSGDTWGQGDFDGNGSVDLDDFVILKNNFGVWHLPEPGTLALLGIGAAALLRRRGGH